jgi:hypothetical protein
MTDAYESTITDTELNECTSSDIENSLRGVTGTSTDLNHILTFLDIAHDEATRDID